MDIDIAGQRTTLASVESLQAIFDSSKSAQSHVDLFDRSSSTKGPNRSGANAAEASNLIDRGIRSLQAHHDSCNGSVDRSHNGTYLQTSEECKPELQSLDGSSGSLNVYPVPMDNENPIIRRLRTLVEHHSEMTQAAWATAANVSEATVSALLTAKPQKGTGKPNRGSFASLARLCAAANVPFWVMVHPSEALFEYILNQPKDRRGELPSSVISVLALVEQSTHSTEEWAKALSEFTPDDRRRTRQKKAGTKKIPAATSSSQKRKAAG